MHKDNETDNIGDKRLPSMLIVHTAYRPFSVLPSTPSCSCTNQDGIAYKNGGPQGYSKTYSTGVCATVGDLTAVDSGGKLVRQGWINWKWINSPGIIGAFRGPEPQTGLCPAGFFQAEAGKSRCRQYPKGTFTSKPGKSSCTHFPSGTTSYGVDTCVPLKKDVRERILGMSLRRFL